MVQDTPMQELPPKPDPEVVMGAVGAAAQERPLSQISPSVPSETVTDRGRSAPLEPSGNRTVGSDESSDSKQY